MRVERATIYQPVFQQTFIEHGPALGDIALQSSLLFEGSCCSRDSGATMLR